MCNNFPQFMLGSCIDVSSGSDWSHAMNFRSDQVKPGPWIWWREFAKSPSVRSSTCWFRGGAPCEPHGSFWGGGGKGPLWASSRVQRRGLLFCTSSAAKEGFADVTQKSKVAEGCCHQQTEFQQNHR